MARYGFIHDKLDIKFLILYLMARAAAPIDFPTLTDLTMCDDGIGYFDFSECLNDLVKTGHLILSEDGLYSITDKGIRNSQICESSLPYSVRLRCDKNLEAWNRKLRRKNQVKAAYEKRSNGTFTVKLNLQDDMGELLGLQLMVPREDMAKAVATRFQKTPERLYSTLLSICLLYTSGIVVAVALLILFCVKTFGSKKSNDLRSAQSK